jgi:hypothetical protein
MVQQQLDRLERQVRVLKVSIVVLLGLLVAGAAMQAPKDAQDVIRTKGLVIVDAKGKDRILLGAPASSDARTRQDDATGLVVLGEDGSDRVVVGFAPGPQVGGQVAQRIADAVGIQINDKDGNERAGFGVLNNGRVVLGLDYGGREAVSLFVLPDEGYAGLLVSGDRDKSHERGGIVIDNKKGDIILKLANENSSESLLLIAPGDGNAKLINRDPASGKTVDVFDQFKP